MTTERINVCRSSLRFEAALKTRQKHIVKIISMRSEGSEFQVVENNLLRSGDVPDKVAKFFKIAPKF